MCSTFFSWSSQVTIRTRVNQLSSNIYCNFFFFFLFHDKHSCHRYWLSLYKDNSPKPNLNPSANLELALWNTQALSTSLWNFEAASADFRRKNKNKINIHSCYYYQHAICIETLPFSVMITSVWPLPYVCMWLTAVSRSETSSMAHANSPYSCFSDLAWGGPKVKRFDSTGPENSCTCTTTTTTTMNNVTNRAEI